MRLQSKAIEKIEMEKLLLYGSLLRWSTALLDWLFPLEFFPRLLSAMALGFFPLEKQGEKT
jgi:hypothetical protein